MFGYLRFRRRRALRRARRQAWLLNAWTLHYLQRHVYGAWRRLLFAGWRFYLIVLLIVISLFGIVRQLRALDSYYLATVPISGGNYSEGLVGRVKILNPILIDSSASSDVDRLIFSGLTQFDGTGQITADMAKSWSNTPDFRSFSFELRDNLHWQDGAPLTADDIAFTIGLIQNPDTRSSLISNWKGVKTTVVSPTSIKFDLPASYPSFLHLTTVGILPQHLLSQVDPTALRLSEFNQRPVGSGPFSFDSYTEQNQIIHLQRNSKYYAGVSKLDSVTFQLYDEPSQLPDGYSKKQILGFGDGSPSQLKIMHKLSQVNLRKLDRPGYIALFFNTQRGILKDKAVRRGLTASINREALTKLPAGANSAARAQDLPLIPAQFDVSYASQLKYDPNTARADLAKLYNNKIPTLSLVTVNSPELVATATEIQHQLATVGVKLTITAVDLDSLEQDYIRPRRYDMILFGQNTGADWDTYNFWHSTQVADPGLNLSSYKSPEADKYLESARLAKDPINRRNKILAFLQTWDADTPAVVLYSPYYLYAQNKIVTSSPLQTLITPPDRFYNIQTWAVRYERVAKNSIHN